MDHDDDDVKFYLRNISATATMIRIFLWIGIILFAVGVIVRMLTW